MAVNTDNPWWGEDFPSPRDSEVVLFASFLDYGLSMPVSNFINGLLYFYKIQLHHLTPQSVLHVSMSVHFCETFRGIEPQFELFHSLYKLIPFPFLRGWIG